MARIVVFALVLGLAASAAALVVDGPNTQRSELPPQDDPGWAHVGRRAGTSAIYLGRGWVLTAKHVGVGDVLFDGTTYPPVVQSTVWLSAPGGGGRKADLVLFRVDPAPELEPLAVRGRTPPPGAFALLVGYGVGRAQPAEWRGVGGFRGARGGVKRWGTNMVQATRIDVPGPNGTVTRCFQTDFSRHGTPHEAQAAHGDSGGAVFIRGVNQWKLAGVMVSVGGLPEQQADAAYYGNVTHVADLSVYRPQIQRAMSAGDPAASQPR
jgi:hypothetical protein